MCKRSVMHRHAGESLDLAALHYRLWVKVAMLNALLTQHQPIFAPSGFFFRNDCLSFLLKELLSSCLGTRILIFLAYISFSEVDLFTLRSESVLRNQKLLGTGAMYLTIPKLTQLPLGVTCWFLSEKTVYQN